MYKSVIKLAVSFLILTMLSLNVNAQVDRNPDGSTGGGDLSSEDGGAVPVDGGLSLLLAAGVGYGVKKVRDSRKKAAEMKNDVTEK